MHVYCLLYEVVPGLAHENIPQWILQCVPSASLEVPREFLRGGYRSEKWSSRLALKSQVGQRLDDDLGGPDPRRWEMFRRENGVHGEELAEMMRVWLWCLIISWYMMIIDDTCFMYLDIDTLCYIVFIQYHLNIDIVDMSIWYDAFRRWWGKPAL